MKGTGRCREGSAFDSMRASKSCQGGLTHRRITASSWEQLVSRSLGAVATPALTVKLDQEVGLGCRVITEYSATMIYNVNRMYAKVYKADINT